MKQPRLSWILVLSLFISCIILTESLGNQCGIQFCTSCDSKTNFCNECDLPYKPGYANQTICTRCANNCGVCEKPGDDSKGRCLSCLPSFNYESDDHCDTFYIWIYAVVIAAYVIFIITLFIVFCYIKRRKDRKSSRWFEALERQYNKVESEKMTMLDFDKLCESLIQLLRESSSYNNLKFRDRQYEMAIKIKSITLKQVNNETHLKKIKIKGFDNSEFSGAGYIYVPKSSNNRIKLWFAKNYTKKVVSEQISKIIIYESEFIDMNEVRGRWYYHGAPDISGEWRGIRHQIDLSPINNVNANLPS